MRRMRKVRARQKGDKEPDHQEAEAEAEAAYDTDTENVKTPPRGGQIRATVISIRESPISPKRTFAVSYETRTLKRAPKVRKKKESRPKASHANLCGSRRKKGCPNSLCAERFMADRWVSETD